MSELQQILASVRALQSSVNSLEVKVGNLIYRQDILETSLHRMMSKLDQVLVTNQGAAVSSRGSATKVDPLPVSPASPTRSHSMTPTPPSRPITPGMPSGRPQIMPSKSATARISQARKPLDAGIYTGTLSAEDMMGEVAPPRTGRGDEDDENGGAGVAYASAGAGSRIGNGVDETNYSASMSSREFEGDAYSTNLTTDAFVDDDSVGGTPVHITTEPAIPAESLPIAPATPSRSSSATPIPIRPSLSAGRPISANKTMPNGKRVHHDSKDSLEGLPMTKPRSSSIGGGLPIPVAKVSPTSESDEAPNPLKGISRSSSEDQPVYNVVRESRGPRAHGLSRTASNESPRFEESSDARGPEGEEVQGPASGSDDDWEKYPEFDVERFNHFRRLTRDEASAKLNPHPDGVYVIRPCGDNSLKNNRDVFVLSFFARSPTNTRTLTNIKVFRFRRGKNRGFGLWGQHPEMFPTMDRMVKHHLPDLRPYDDSLQ